MGARLRVGATSTESTSSQSHTAQHCIAGVALLDSTHVRKSPGASILPKCGAVSWVPSQKSLGSQPGGLRRAADVTGCRARSAGCTDHALVPSAAMSEIFAYFLCRVARSEAALITLKRAPTSPVSAPASPSDSGRTFEAPPAAVAAANGKAAPKAKHALKVAC